MSILRNLLHRFSSSSLLYSSFRAKPYLHFIRLKFTLNLEDIKRSDIIGSGPGGQKVARTRNCVVLTHLPTGIIVRCHDSRDVKMNYRLALKRLTDRVELQLYGEESSVWQKSEAKRIANKERKEASRAAHNARVEAKRLREEEEEKQEKEGLVEEPVEDVVSSQPGETHSTRERSSRATLNSLFGGSNRPER